jgi:hypothetical protein
LAFLRALIVLEPESSLAGTSGSRIWSSARFPGPGRPEPTLAVLSYLGPEIVRALLAGSQANALTPSRLLRLSKNLPHDWKEQRCFLGFAA